MYLQYISSVVHYKAQLTVSTLFGDRPAPLEVDLVGHEYLGAAVAAVLAGEVLQRLARILE